MRNKVCNNYCLSLAARFSCGEKLFFSPQLWDKIWDQPGNDAIILPYGCLIYPVAQPDAGHEHEKQRSKGTDEKFLTPKSFWSEFDMMRKFIAIVWYPNLDLEQGTTCTCELSCQQNGNLQERVVFVITTTIWISLIPRPSPSFPSLAVR